MKNNTLISKDIAPTLHQEKEVSSWGFFNIWIGMSVMLAVFETGANGLDSLSLWSVALAIFVANLIIALICSLTADIGIEHGLPFSAFLRAPFGIIGVHFPAISRGLL